MKTLWRELMKIVRQFRGSENIFGYKTTVANQLYLFYCLSGKIYFTDKIHKHVKYLWFGIASCQILFSFVIGWTYLCNEGTKNDLGAMFIVANAISGLLTVELLIPLISLLYSNSIETMIDRVDSILAIYGVSDSNQKKVVVDAKRNFMTFIGPTVIFLIIQISICFLDVSLLFEESKVKNYLYYGFPVFVNQKYSSIEWYFIINGISSMILAVISCKGFWCLGVISYWGTVWCNEIISLRDELHTAMRDLDVYLGADHGNCSDEWNEAFERILKRTIRKFRKITLLIDDMRGCYEVYGTVLVSGIFLFNMFFLYASFSSDISAVLVVKGLLACSSCIIIAFFFYWTGQNLENSVSELSMEIYFTPWYRSVKTRKNVYISLCQIESTKSFRIFKVYWLLFNNFSRYMHALVSYTNILYKLNKK